MWLECGLVIESWPCRHVAQNSIFNLPSMHTCTCMHTHIYRYRHIHTVTHTKIDKHAYTYTQIQTQIHICTHTVRRNSSFMVDGMKRQCESQMSVLQRVGWLAVLTDLLHLRRRCIRLGSPHLVTLPPYEKSREHGSGAAGLPRLCSVAWLVCFVCF